MNMNRRTGEAESVKDKRAKALELRIAGGSYRAIARDMHCSQQSAFRYVQTALAELDQLTQARAERLRELEVARCDQLTLALWRRATQGDAKSVHAIVRVMDRRAKLLGLDAPIETRHAGADGEPLTIRHHLADVSTEILDTISSLLSGSDHSDAGRGSA